MATTLIDQLIESLVEEVTKRVLIHFDTLSLRLQVLEKAHFPDGIDAAVLHGRISELEQKVRGIQDDFTYDVNAIIRTRFYDDEIPDEGRVKDLIEMYAPEEGVSLEDVIELINDRVRITVE